MRRDPGGSRLPLPVRLLARLAPAELREQIVDDVVDEHRRRRRERGLLVALAWSWRQLLDPRLVWLRRELRREDGERRVTIPRTARRPHIPGSRSMRDELQRSRTSLDSLGTEVRAVLRGLRRTPTFTVVSVLTLALGIGATAAIFGVVDNVLLRPLPYARAARLEALRWHRPDGQEAGMPFGHFAELRERADTFSSMGWIVRPQVADEIVLRSDAGAQLVDGLWTSANLFRVLGVRLVLGSGFPASANEPGNENVVVLSHRAWVARFGSDPAILGRQLQINGRAHEVVGVLPASFELPGYGREPQVWLPQRVTAEMAEERESWALDVVGRVADGVAPERAAHQAESLGAELAERYPIDWGGFVLDAVPLRDRLLGPARGGLMLLLAAAGAVLLVGCSNLAHLLLARTAARRHELAVRIALGARGVRLARPLVVESLVLGVAGGGLGLVTALWTARRLLDANPVPLPREVHMAIDGRLLLFTVCASVLSGLLFSLVPALRAGRIGSAVMRGSRAAGGAADRRFRGLLVAAESAVVLTLLIAAALSLSSLRSLLAVDPGFVTDQRLTMTLNLPQDRYRSGDPEPLHAFLAELEERLPALPGVRAAGTISHLPLGRNGWGGTLYVEGRPVLDAGEMTATDWELASPGYFAAAGIPVLEGRGFDATDRRESTVVTVVNETLARTFFPDGDALGQRITGSSADGPWRTIVGVVADVKQHGLGELTRPYMYLPAMQVMPWAQQELVVWVSGDPESALPAVEGALRHLEPEIAISGAQPMAQLVRGAVSGPRFRMLLLGLFGTLAVALGAVGIYGVVAYAMSQRTRELGVRMALGAAPGSLVRRSMLGGLKPVAWGMAAGLAGGVAVGRVMASTLYGIDAADPWTLACSVVLLGAVAAVAAWAPARHAARVDPALSLRAE